MSQTNNNDNNNNSVALNQHENSSKNKLNSIELAKIYNLKGSILLENGYFTKSNKYFKLATNIFSNILKNDFHPLLINNHYDEIYSNMYSFGDFEIIKNSILELIAKSQMLENSYLIFKGYVYLALIFMQTGNTRSAIAFSKYAFKQLPSTQRKELISNAITLKCLSIYIASNSKIEKDKFYLNFEKELKDSINKNKRKNENENKLSLIELELFSFKVYQETVFTFNLNTLYSRLDKINSAIKILEENNMRNNNLALLYLKKWSFEIFFGREATAKYYLDESQKIINSTYSLDSFKNIEFLRSMIINSLNIHPPKIDLALEILRKTKKVADELNCNALQQKFFIIAVSLRSGQSGVAEIFNLYEDFLNSASKYFKNDSEILFDIKDFLRASKLGFVYKNKQDKKI